MAEQEGPLLLFDNISGYRRLSHRDEYSRNAAPFCPGPGLATELPKLEISLAGKLRLPFHRWKFPLAR
jgi:hypothetical protein